MTRETTYIYGKHAVAEALTFARDAVEELYASDNFDDSKILALAEKSGARRFDLKKGLPFITRDGTHQGIIAKIALEHLVIPYKQFIETTSAQPNSLLVLLDEVQDPHNVGSIIRSAAALGAQGILIPSNNQAPITGTVIKVSAGMAFRIPLVAIGNVNQTLRDLKERGYWTYGLAGEGAVKLSEETFDAATVLVVGNEGEGIRQKTQETCDVMLSIPMNPRCESLNAAVSAAIALYAWSTRHPNAL